MTFFSALSSIVLSAGAPIDGAKRAQVIFSGPGLKPGVRCSQANLRNSLARFAMTPLTFLPAELARVP